MRDSLNKLKENNKALRSGAITLTLLNIALADTEQEYRKQMNLLPVRVVKKTTHPRAGTSREVTEYWIGDKMKHSRVQDVRDSSREITSTPILEDGSSNLIASSSVFCEYTDPVDSEYFSGDCATTQDLDDAYTVYYSAEIEAVYYQEEYYDAHMECKLWGSDCGPSEEADATSSVAFFRDVILEDGWPSAPTSFEEYSAGPSCAINPITRPSCESAGFAYAGGLAGWFGGAAKLYRLLAIGTTAVPAIAPATLAITVTIATVTLGVLTYAYVNCVYVQ
jgi:hypothetical protein